jgi:micrococcal nuclease
MSRRKRGAVLALAASAVSAFVFWTTGIRVPPAVITPALVPEVEVLEERWRPEDGTIVDVVRVVDGDTVEVSDAGRRIMVRIIGIDTPETVHPSRPVEAGGPEASARARELLDGKRVVLDYDRDPRRDQFGTYGRLLSYVELEDGRDYGLVMIQEGFAKAYTRYPFTREAIYVAAEAARDD